MGFTISSTVRSDDGEGQCEKRRAGSVTLERPRFHPEASKSLITAGDSGHAGASLYTSGLQLRYEGIERSIMGGHTGGSAGSTAARLISYSDGQLDAAEETISESMDKADQFEVCKCRYLLGNICHSSGETEKTITGTTSRQPSGLGPLLVGRSPVSDSLRLGTAVFRRKYICSMTRMLTSNATGHRSHATDNPYKLGCAMQLQAGFCYQRRMLKDAESEI